MLIEYVCLNSRTIVFFTAIGACNWSEGKLDHIYLATTECIKTIFAFVVYQLLYFITPASNKTKDYLEFQLFCKPLLWLEFATFYNQSLPLNALTSLHSDLFNLFSDTYLPSVLFSKRTCINRSKRFRRVIALWSRMYTA